MPGFFPEKQKRTFDRPSERSETGHREHRADDENGRKESRAKDDPRRHHFRGGRAPRKTLGHQVVVGERDGRSVAEARGRRRVAATDDDESIGRHDDHTEKTSARESDARRRNEMQAHHRDDENKGPHQRGDERRGRQRHAFLERAPERPALRGGGEMGCLSSIKRNFQTLVYSTGTHERNPKDSLNRACSTPNPNQIGRQHGVNPTQRRAILSVVKQDDDTD
jgi:hypothetical protein